MKSIRVMLIETGIELSPFDERKLIEAIKEWGKSVVEHCSKAAQGHIDKKHSIIAEIEEVKQSIK